jgi:hypothetical protein
VIRAHVRATFAVQPAAGVDAIVRPEEHSDFEWHAEALFPYMALPSIVARTSHTPVWYA